MVIMEEGKLRYIGIDQEDTERGKKNIPLEVLQKEWNRYLREKDHYPEILEAQKRVLFGKTFIPSQWRVFLGWSIKRCIETNLSILYRRVGIGRLVMWVRWKIGGF